MNSAEVIPTFIMLSLKFSSVYHIDACHQGTDIDVWIPFGTTFGTTTVLWLNSNGTGVPVTGWYSDETNYRQWDGVSLLVASNVCTTTFAALNFDAVEGVPCTAGTSSNYYFDAGNFANASGLWTNVGLTTPAAVGWYSDTVSLRHWDGTVPLSVVQVCPNYQSEVLGFGANVTDACGLAATTTMYYPIADTFDATTLLWKDAINTLADAQWYSDGVYGRNWNGSAFIATEYCDTEDIGLGFDAVEASACTAGLNLFFMEAKGDAFISTLAIYTDVEKTTSPPAGWYSDLTTVREWNGIVFISTNACS